MTMFSIFRSWCRTNPTLYIRTLSPRNIGKYCDIMSAFPRRPRFSRVTDECRLVRFEKRTYNRSTDFADCFFVISLYQQSALLMGYHLGAAKNPYSDRTTPSIGIEFWGNLHHASPRGIYLLATTKPRKNNCWTHQIFEIFRNHLLDIYPSSKHNLRSLQSIPMPKMNN